MRLTHVVADGAGYTRKGRGKGFTYFDVKGAAITDKEDLNRIKALRIPPAWRDVWICANPTGHLQATGLDARGRKQYLYHEEWTRLSSLQKFDRMAGFAKALPQMRKKVAAGLRKQGWPREKVISLVITILDQSGIRIGNKAYETENGTYGLTTLRRKHLKVEKGQIVFEFKAKGGIYRKTAIKSKRLSRLIKECSELPGQEIFRFEDEEGQTYPVYSQDVNAYIQEISESDFTAKDFRTWTGTVGAIELLAETLQEKTPGTKTFTTSLVRKVAERLGNTMAVCRSSYIHPCMLKLAENADIDLDSLVAEATKAYKDLADDLSSHELTALYLIEKS